MTAKERLCCQTRGQEVDRIPSIGGWMNGARNLAELAGLSVAEYLNDPLGGVVRANKRLEADGMVQAVVPRSVDEVRSAHELLDGDFAQVEPEDVVKYADSLPDTEKEVLRSFDAAAREKGYRDYIIAASKKWDGLEFIPNFWEIGGPFPLYHQFGYTAFLSACALCPEAVEKIWWARALHARECSKIMGGLYREFDLVPLMFCGEDLCNNHGPMVSPVMLRKHYMPLVKMIIQPLVEAGVRVIHHCDGDVRPVLDDYLSIGFSGLQGFQFELGVDLRAIAFALCGWEITLSCACALASALLPSILRSRSFACCNITIIDQELWYGCPSDRADSSPL